MLCVCMYVYKKKDTLTRNQQLEISHGFPCLMMRTVSAIVLWNDLSP